MNERQPRALIGVTGNIATGKSTVARMLGRLGAEVIDADKVVHDIMGEHTRVYHEIAETFGSKILQVNGEIDRQRLGSIVFSDPKAMAQLEAIVHPATIDRIRQRVAGSSAPVIVIEAVKLIESGLADVCHQVWVTVCPADQQVARLIDERGLSRTDAELRVSAQPSQEDKLAHADVTIDTSGTIAHTQAQVQEAWNRLCLHLECGPDIEYNGNDASSRSPVQR